MKKPLPIGVSDFREVIERGYAYVDKSLLIQELIERKPHVALIQRMRRFGKTLNLSMLRYFFEKTSKDNSHLFKSLKIWKNVECRALQGQFPVIFFSLKDVKHDSWEKAFSSLRRLIAFEFDRHGYLLEGDLLSAKEKAFYHQIVAEEDNQTATEQSLFFLTKWLHRYHGKQVILLIDEYDTPVHAAYEGKYYDKQILFLRNWLSSALKDNSSLEWGILTGILRIAKESIFSGLNNIATFTILNDGFQDKFGLTEGEVEHLLSEFGLQQQLPELRKWYNGYRIGSLSGVYNPWSVMNCIAAKGALVPYWVNTSENALMKQLITQGSDELKTGIEELLRGETIERVIEEGVVFSDLEKRTSVVWALLLFCGYLTSETTPSYGSPYRLRLPNLEVKELYTSMILGWFNATIESNNYRLLLESLTTGDVVTFSQIFQKFLLSSVSVFDVSPDEPEKIYHAFVLGMLIGLSDTYEVKSNRESGFGRYDVMLIPKDPKKLGIIMEFKKIESYDPADLESAVTSALHQIEAKQYAQELRDRGVHRILRLALAFKGKQVLIRAANKEG